MPSTFLRAVFLSLLTLPVLPAQVSITGRITGVVTDASGAPIAGASVTASSPALMSPRTVSTQPDGSFLMDQLPTGLYEVNSSLKGFRSVLQKGVELTAGFTANLPIKMDVGELTQTITVEGQEPVVDVKSASAPTTFDVNLLQNMPSGRDPWSTVTQAPGATSSTFDVGGNQSYQQSSMSIHGSKPSEQVYSFNGLRMNWPGSSGGFTAFYIDYDALQEFQLVTDAAPAEVAVGGTYMNIVTKSGSNQIHGMAAGYYLTNAWQSQINLPQFNGAAVNAGSPFVMSRDTSANLGAPILKDRLWIFGAYRRYDIKQNFLAVRKKDGSPISDVNHQSDITLRTDLQIDSKNRVNLQWMYNSQNRFFRRSTAYQYVFDEASQRQIEPAYVLQGQYTGYLGPNLVVDARFGYLHILFPLAYQPSVKPTDLSYADSTLSTLRGAAQNNYLNPAETFRWATSVSYYKGAFLGGSHNFKAGYEGSYNTNGDFYNINGDINVFLNNNVPLQVQIFNSPVRSRSNFNEHSFFLQDAWTIAKRLTVNVGLRLDHYLAYNPAQTSPAPAVYASLFPNRTFARSADLVNWSNLAPRFSAAYDVTGKSRSVIRAGFNKFNLIEGTRLGAAVNPNSLGGQTYRWTDTNGDGIPQQSEFLSSANFLGSFGGIVTRIDPKISRPYSYQVNVGYEQQVLGDVRVGVSYYYRTTKNQISRRNAAILPTDYTAVTSLGGSPIVNPLNNQTLTLFNVDPAKVGKVDYVLTNVSALDDNAYHGLEFTAVKRLSKRWQVLAGFTLQRNKGTYGSGLGDDFNNPNRDINRKNAFLDQDSPRVFKLDATYRWPWRLTTSANFQHTSGYPLLPTNVYRGFAQNSETIFLAPRGADLGLKTCGPTGATTNCALRFDGVNVVNLRISRPIPFLEGKLMLEPVADLFNVGNNSPVLNKATGYGPNFLRPSDVLNPFVARFGLKITF